MYAIEFRTNLQNGIIEVPRKYQDKLKNNIKVILLTEEEETSFNMIDKLLDSPLEAEDFLVTRVSLGTHSRRICLQFTQQSSTKLGR